MECTFAKPIQETRFLLDVPPAYMRGGHILGLHSGELESRSEQSKAIITVRIHNRPTKMRAIATCCVTLYLCDFLELAKQGGEIPWRDWEGYTFTSEKEFDTHVYSDFSVSGSCLVGPLEEVRPNWLEVEIQEFDFRCGSHVFTSDGDSPVGTDSASLVDIEVMRGEEGDGSWEVVRKVSPSAQRVTLQFTYEGRDLTGLWTNVAIVGGHLTIVFVCGCLR